MSNDLLNEIEKIISVEDWKRKLRTNSWYVILCVVVLLCIFVGVGFFFRSGKQYAYTNNLFSAGERALFSGKPSAASNYFRQIIGEHSGVYSCLSRWHMASVSIFERDFGSAASYYGELDDVCTDRVLNGAAKAFLGVVSGDRSISKKLNAIFVDKDYGAVFDEFGVFGDRILIAWLLINRRFGDLLVVIDHLHGFADTEDLAMYKKIKILIVEQKKMLKDLLK